MKCPNCGKEISNDSLFCEYCGAKINFAVNNSTDKPKVKWGLLILGIVMFGVGGYFMIESGSIIGILMLLVIGGIIGFAAYRSGKAKQ